MLIARKLTVLCGMLLTSPLALAGDLTAEQRDIFSGVRGSSELITEDMHRRFWDQFSETDREATRNGASQIAYFALLDWLGAANTRSRYETRESGKMTKAPELGIVRAKLLAIVPRDQWQSWVNEFAEDDKELSSKLLLQPEKSKSSPEEGFILTNRGEAIAQREQLLLNPVWSDAPRRWSYPPMRLTLNWPYRWSAGCGPMFKCVNWGMVLSAGDTGSMGVRFYGNADYGKAALQLGGLALDLFPAGIDYIPEYKLISQTSNASEWQGHDSAKFTSVVDITSETRPQNYRVSRVVLDPDRKVAWVLIATSSISQAEAGALFDRLEGAIDLQ